MQCHPRFSKQLSKTWKKSGKLFYMGKTETVEKKAKLQRVSPDLLDFDPSNPRFAGSLKSRSPDDIQKELFGEPYYASALVDSLVENGFIDYEPLVVRRSGERFIVVEGNRRLAAIREIRANLEKYPNRKSDLGSIPVLVFPDKPDSQHQEEMRVYLGVRHLLGFREWPPFSKAQFLENESKVDGGLDRILKETRMTKQQARRFLIPFRLLNEAGEKLPKGEDFWVLGEALQRAGVKNYIQLEVDSKTLGIMSYSKKQLGLLLNDLYGPKKQDGNRDTDSKVVYDTRDLSRLSKVLGSPKATLELRSGKSLEEAEIFVDTREKSIKRLSKVTNELGVLVKKLLKGSRGIESTRLLQSYKGFEAAVKTFTSKEP
jgi:hypothetical protein